MNIRKALTASVLAVSMTSTAAFAVSVTNRDDHDHKVTVVEGKSSKDHVLKPDGVLDNVCLKGCIIRLNDSEDDEYELEGNEIVSIEDGYLYYDGPDAPAEPPPGGEAKGSKSEPPKK